MHLAIFLWEYPITVQASFSENQYFSRGEFPLLKMKWKRDLGCNRGISQDFPYCIRSIEASLQDNLSYSLTKIMRKFGETIRQFWQKYSHFEKIGENFLSFSHDFITICVSANTSLCVSYLYTLPKYETSLKVLLHCSHAWHLLNQAFDYRIGLDNGSAKNMQKLFTNLKFKFNLKFNLSYNGLMKRSAKIYIAQIKCLSYIYYLLLQTNYLS